MKKLLIIPGLLLAAVTLASCGGSSSSSSDGTLTLRVTDAPMDGVDNVWIKFDSIEVKPENGSAITFSLAGTQAIDLAALQNGEQMTLLNGVTLPAGKYNWIRIGVNLLDDGETPPGGNYTTAGVCFVEADGDDYPLYIPSGMQTGLKLNRGIVIPVGGDADFTLDFDLRKSLRYRESDDAYVLKPVIRMVDNTVVGSISGDVTNIPAEKACEDGAVYLFTGPAATPDDVNGTATEPLAVFKTQEFTEGVCGYVASYLEPGTYTLAFTWDSAIDDPDVNDTLTFVGTGDAVVATDATTDHDIALP